VAEIKRNMETANTAQQKSKPDFELYLMRKFTERNPMVLDDELPDAFDAWICDQHIDDIIQWANKWREAA
jgi:hypothetical protein